MFFVSTSWRQSVEWVLDLKVQVCKCLVKSNIHVWWINRKWSALINGFKHGNKNTFIAHSSNIEYGFLWVLTFFIPWRWLFKDIDYYVKIHDVWHCMYHEPYCNVYINQRDAQILVNSLSFFSLNGSTCFRLSLVHHQEQHLISCTVPVPVRLTAVWHECTNCTVQLIKCCSWWWTNDNPKHVEPFNAKKKDSSKELYISLVYIHIHDIPCNGTICMHSDSQQCLLRQRNSKGIN